MSGSRCCTFYLCLIGTVSGWYKQQVGNLSETSAASSVKPRGDVTLEHQANCISSS